MIGEKELQPGDFIKLDWLCASLENHFGIVTNNKCIFYAYRYRSAEEFKICFRFIYPSDKVEIADSAFGIFHYCGNCGNYSFNTPNFAHLMMITRNIRVPPKKVPKAARVLFA